MVPKQVGNSVEHSETTIARGFGPDSRERSRWKAVVGAVIRNTHVGRRYRRTNVMGKAADVSFDFALG